MRADRINTRVGADSLRVEGLEKLRGAAQYVDDIRVEDVWHGATVRAPAARGRITQIGFDPGIPWDEFVIVDHRDIPGANHVALIEQDQPVLVTQEFRHKHEPVVLLAHRSPDVLRRGVRGVRIEYEPLPCVLDPVAPLTAERVQFGADNIFKCIDIRRGDLDAAFAAAVHVVEGEYQTGAQEHLYIEPQGMLATVGPEGLVVRGSLQCPYYVLGALCEALGCDESKVRVIQTETGGAFGGKEDYPSLIAIHTALLAMKTKAPVKIIYDREEDMAATTKRHPSWVRHRTALDSDGRILGAKIDVVLDAGAYVTLSPVVLSRGVLHALGPYSCESVHIHGEARLTNSPPYGAFRGFGAPQTLFAAERHMDVIAGRLGLDPAELRRRNLLRDGQCMATGQVYRDGVDLVGLMDRTLEHAAYRRRKEECERFNASHAYLRRGVGLATFMHGAGFTGSGETTLASEVCVEGRPDGSVEVLTANTEMGQGTRTILAQIAADVLALPDGRVTVAIPDTARVPNSGPTVASRTVMIVGKLVERACLDLRDKVDGAGGDLAKAIAAWHQAHPDERLLGRAKYQTPPEIHWDEKTYRGDAYACYAWATYVAAVEVDLRTYGVTVTDFVAAQDVGKVINPTLARGQIQGGVAQGIGWALTEEVVLKEGTMANAQLTNYIIPTSADLPPIHVFFEEQLSRYGPGGAKGIGELPMDGPAPAVINAVCHALRTALSRIPLTPERLMERLDSASHE
jgi:CO/xanthine dehydrogenase Mo-binding subunit